MRREEERPSVVPPRSVARAGRRSVRAGSGVDRHDGSAVPLEGWPRDPDHRPGAAPAPVARVARRWSRRAAGRGILRPSGPTAPRTAANDQMCHGIAAPRGGLRAYHSSRERPAGVVRRRSRVGSSGTLVAVAAGVVLPGFGRARSRRRGLSGASGLAAPPRRGGAAGTGVVGVFAAMPRGVGRGARPAGAPGSARHVRPVARRRQGWGCARPVPIEAARPGAGRVASPGGGMVRGVAGAGCGADGRAALGRAAGWTEERG